MNNTTKGEWTVIDVMSSMEEDGQRSVYVQSNNRAVAEALGETEEEELANARLIALAGNLNQRYDLSKLEAATEELRHIWENEDPEFVVLAVDNFLRAITLRA